MINGIRITAQGSLAIHVAEIDIGLRSELSLLASESSVRSRQCTQDLDERGLPRDLEEASPLPRPTMQIGVYNM